MLLKRLSPPWSLVAALLLTIGGSAFAQAPPSIQFFMPDGSLPSRELRFTLAADNGRIETYYTDSKGKFLITRLEGLKSDAGYTIAVEGDGRAFAATSISFKEFGVYYIPVFLKAIKSEATRPARLIDLAELDLAAPEEARQSYAAAMRLVRAGQRADAVRELEHALSIYPDYFRALNDLGVIYMNLERLDAAAQMFERAIKIGPHVYYPRLNLAITDTRLAKYKEAINILEQLHKETPMLTDVRIALGDALMSDGRLDPAERHLRAALGDPKIGREQAGDVHYKLGLLLNRKQQYDAAVGELSQAVQVLPGSARSHLQLGGALLQVKRLDDAERELLAAYRIGSVQMGGAQLMLGQIYYQQKKYESALRAFEQYLADVPLAPNAGEMKGVIEKIRVSLNRK